jgi:hypothetical protein
LEEPAKKLIPENANENIKDTVVNTNMQQYVPPKPAPLPVDFDEFFSSLAPNEKALHYLAHDKLGSSYFVQWTHMYTKWSKMKAEKEQKSE